MIGTIVSLAAFGIAVMAFSIWGKREKKSHYDTAKPASITSRTCMVRPANSDLSSIGAAGVKTRLASKVSSCARSRDSGVIP